MLRNALVLVLVPIIVHRAVERLDERVERAPADLQGLEVLELAEEVPGGDDAVGAVVDGAAVVGDAVGDGEVCDLGVPGALDEVEDDVFEGVAAVDVECEGFERWDDEAHAAYSYDPGSRELISYDNVRSATDKAAYIRDRGGGGGGLGGAFFWEASGDRRDDRSLIKTMAAKLGKLETSQNNLKYPTSQYENIRKGMPS